MDTREASIVAQVAAKAAAQVCQGTSDSALYLAMVETVHNDLLDRLKSGLTPAAAPQPTAAPAPAPAPAPVAAAPNPVATVAQAFGGAVSVLHGKSTQADMMVDALAHPDDWVTYNTEKSSVNGGRSPDLKHKTIKDGQYAIGIWLYDEKYKRHAPENLWTAFGFSAQYQQKLADGSLLAN